MAFPAAFYKWRPHPWHGLKVGPNPPDVVHAYIEITPFDSVKYELDKSTGYMRVDRPQRSSSTPPALYGFIPRTFCGNRVKDLLEGVERGDADPLDICVVSERPINRSEVLLNAKVVGGIPMIDNGEADHKIIAVLANDNLWGGVTDISQMPSILIERLRHYFATYKLIPDEASQISLGKTFGHEEAWGVIKASMDDYEDEFGNG